MKSERKYQHRFLTKVIDQCELANGLAHSLDTLTRRDLKNNVGKLVEAGIPIPLDMRIIITKRRISFVCDDLLENVGAKGSAEKVKQFAKELVSLLVEWDREKVQEWSFAVPQWATLSFQLQADLEDEDRAESAEHQIQAGFLQKLK